jgi:hypothetical protein
VPHFFLSPALHTRISLFCSLSRTTDALLHGSSGLVGAMSWGWCVAQGKSVRSPRLPDSHAVRRGCRIHPPSAVTAGSICHPLWVSDPPAVRHPARSTLPHSFPSSPTAATASVPPQLGQNISDNELLCLNTCRPSIQFVFSFLYSVDTYLKSIISISNTYPTYPYFVDQFDGVCWCC